MSPAGDSPGDRRGDDRIDGMLRRALPMASPQLLRALARGLAGSAMAGRGMPNASAFDPDRSNAELQRLTDPIALLGRHRTDLAEYANIERSRPLPMPGPPSPPTGSPVAKPAPSNPAPSNPAPSNPPSGPLPIVPGPPSMPPPSAARRGQPAPSNFSPMPAPAADWGPQPPAFAGPYGPVGSSSPGYDQQSYGTPTPRQQPEQEFGGNAPPIRAEDDTVNPSYLVGRDSDDLFGTDQSTVPPIIGE